VDLATTRAQANGVTPAINCEGGQRPSFAWASQNVPAAAVLLDAVPPPSIDGVDRLYRLLGGNPRHHRGAAGGARSLALGMRLNL
jgi:hypothetical protein